MTNLTNHISKNNNVSNVEYYEILPFKDRVKLPKIDIQDVQKLAVATIELGVNLTILTGFLTVKTLNFIVKNVLLELQKEPQKVSNNDNSSFEAQPKKLTKIVTTTVIETYI